MIQPARVLPSNAPPLDTGSGHTSRVLQEDSGNRQHIDYTYHSNSEAKYPSTLLTENSYARHEPQHQARHVYQQTPSQRHHYRYGHSRHHSIHVDQGRVEKTARYLYHRFRNSDQYMKYRTKQHKDDRSGAAQSRPVPCVWPDRMELAFFQALVAWPPMGRRKLPHKDKQRGRNELIADYIEELTGETRNRKQVSSHIQVLKPFVEHDPFIMKWLSKEDLSGPVQGRQYGARASSYHGGRSMSNYPVPSLPNGMHHSAHSITHPDGFDLSKFKRQLDVFQPTDFSMFVQRKLGDDEPQRLHTYTSAIKHPLQQDEQIHDWHTLEQRYPLLHTMHKRRPLDCNTVVAEASLAFPTETFKDKPGVELGISFLCASRHLPANAQIRCLNTFYKDGNLLKDHTLQSEVNLTAAEDGTRLETQLKFGSNFWARTLAYLAGVLQKSNDDTERDPREEVTTYLNGITASQEVLVVTQQGLEKLLVVYWKFRLSRGEQGRAYWMKVLLPPSSAEYADPKAARVDSVYDYSLGFSEAATSSHPIQTSQSGLQSPFEYDSSSGSALTSATWSASLDDGGINTAPHSAIDFTSDSAFDFTGGNINMSSYDPCLDFSTFDSSAFNFDTTADFAADPALQDYNTQPTGDFAQPQDYDCSTQWTDGYAGFDSQQSVTGASNNPVLSTDSQGQVFDTYSGHYDQAYHHVGAEGQAYGGAGQDAEALAALADASYLAHPAQ